MHGYCSNCAFYAQVYTLHPHMGVFLLKKCKIDYFFIFILHNFAHINGMLNNVYCIFLSYGLYYLIIILYFYINSDINVLLEKIIIYK